MKAFVCVIAALLCFADQTLHAQDIEAQLAGSTVSSGFTVLDNNKINLFSVRGNRRVGIGTVTPSATLHIIGSDGLLATGSRNMGSIPTTGPGTRMMWYPKKAAFRVGNVGGTQWDDANIGAYSLAAGKETIASGDYSIALGYKTTASADYATALGYETTASDLYSTAMGNYTTASGQNSIAMGAGTIASGINSTAMGNATTASGLTSFAMGAETLASGDFSTAMGTKMSTNGMKGSFMIGDAYALATTSATHAHRYYARFHNGYVLYTRTDRSTGVQALSGANSWSSVSDSTRKENLRLAQGEHVLNAFRPLRLGSWNYIGDNQRHYGPMAQEWFSAFGRDGIGTIGDDTTLASADVDGILCIAVQELERRTSENNVGITSVDGDVAALRARLEARDAEIAHLQNEIVSMQQENAQRDAKYNELVRLVHGLQEQQQRTEMHHVQLIRTETEQ